MKRQTRTLMMRLLVLLAALSAALYISTPSSKASADNPQQEQIAQGRKLYMSNCASCHGTTGHGNGPVAGALKNKPSDLTVIRKQQGKYPAEEIQRIISGEMKLPVHGEREMPVWGASLTPKQIAALVRYLESIQQLFEIPAD